MTDAITGIETALKALEILMNWDNPMFYVTVIVLVAMYYMTKDTTP